MEISVDLRLRSAALVQLFEQKTLAFEAGIRGRQAARDLASRRRNEFVPETTRALTGERPQFIEHRDVLVATGGSGEVAGDGGDGDIERRESDAVLRDLGLALEQGAALDDAPDHREHAADGLLLIVGADRRLRIGATEQQQRRQRVNSRECRLAGLLGAQ